MRGKFAMLLNPEVAQKKGCASTSQIYKLFLALSSRGEGLG